MRRRDPDLPQKAWLTSEQAARLLGLSRAAVLELIRADELPCRRTSGGHRRIPLAAVHAYQRRQAQAAKRLAGRGCAA